VIKTSLHARLILFIIGALLLAACSPIWARSSEPATTPEPSDGSALGAQEPGTLRVGTTYIWDTANPATGWYNQTLRGLLYDSLIEQTGLSSFAPGLAEDWTLSEDGLVWTFKVRDGVTFHDGTACAAGDIAWSLNWSIKNKIATFGPYLANADGTSAFQEIVALDPGTLQVTLSAPLSNLEYVLSQVWILPKSVWEGLSAAEIPQFEDRSAGVGTGPYRLVDWVEGEYLVLEANQAYWQGAPAIRRIVWKQFPSRDAVVQALLAGEIDAVAADTIPLTSMEAVQTAEDIRAVIMDSANIDELILNSHERGTQPASLKDPAVRLAIAHAIDKQQIVKEVALGYAEPATVVIPPTMGAWHNPEVEDVPFDLAEANRILQQAGYKDNDRDDIREDSKGQPLKYRLYAGNDPTSARIQEIISGGLSKIGISTLPVTMDEESLLVRVHNSDFDLVYWGWELDADPGPAMLIFTCGQRGGRTDGTKRATSAGATLNDSGYCNKDFDAAYQQQATAADHEARRELIWQMQAKLFNERPYIMLTYARAVQAYRSDRFTGFGLAAGDILWKAALLQARPVQ
jgi:peptide/nickel transport system substrate-binding protein